MSLKPGDQLDDYRIVRPIGRGAYSTVYRAEHDGLDSAVAIKVLADNWALDPDARIRFLSEGQLARRVASPAIAAVFDVGETPAGQPYLVYELADRGDLAIRLARLDQPASTSDLLRLAEALRDGLSAIHREGIVHRDVKPENLLLAGRGPRPEPDQLLAEGERLLLADLGLAKDLALGSGFTAATGTAAYRAPEQTHPGSIVDERADIHAATAVIAHAACGSRPDDVTAWSTHIEQRALEPRLNAALAKGLSTEPSHRPQTMQAWFQTLHEALEPTPPPLERRQSTRRTATIGLTIAAALVFATWWIRGSQVDNGTASIQLEENGRLIATAERDGFEVILLGPEQLEVGQPGRYSARVEPDAQLVWLTDNGPLQGSETLEVIPQETGIIRIVLLAVPETERVIRVEFLTQVTD